jgi:hypothetical protein
MDKVQKHNSFNTNTPSSESYKNDNTNGSDLYSEGASFESEPSKWPYSLTMSAVCSK